MGNSSEKVIAYVIGDATEPIGEGTKIVPHCVNTIGAWGAGFVVALSKKSRVPEEYYRKWHSKGFYTSRTTGKVPFALGNVQFAPFKESVIVCNLVGQEGVGYRNGPPIRYEAIESGFNKMREFLTGKDYSVHMPRIGCGLAGGSWDEIEAIIKKTLCDHGIQVTVYDLE